MPNDCGYVDPNSQLGKAIISTKKPDVIATYDGGSLYVFSPQNKEALAWLKENADSQGWQWLGDSLAVDHRHAGTLVEGLANDGGFRVSVR